MLAGMDFWDVMWSIFVCSIFFAWLVLLFNIVGDLFRREMSGAGKAAWTAALIFFPILTSIIYIVVRGADERPYPGSVDELAKAESMLNSGVLDQAEYEALKRKSTIAGSR